MSWSTAWRELADDPQVSRNSTMPSVLNSKLPGNLTPIDIRFPDITIRHLLESASGIDRNTVRAVLAAARAEDESGSRQPFSLANGASRVAGKMLLLDPLEFLAERFGGETAPWNRRVTVPTTPAARRSAGRSARRRPLAV
ncbi:MAG: hypothetical protein U5L05_01230 [Rubrivivax sp.]|nr:hypothetical protein [Rubrivivax sp.]